MRLKCWWYWTWSLILPWCKTSPAPVPSPGTGISSSYHPALLTSTSSALITDQWQCPELVQQPVVECSCDIPHTLRCTGDKSAMPIISDKLRKLPSISSVSLLDCTIQNLTALDGSLLNGVALHGLVISSGELQHVATNSFAGLLAPLQALGLPNNKLATVPIAALQRLAQLDRLDLSNNLLNNINQESFKKLENLSFLDLSDNRIEKITPLAFARLSHLRVLRVRGNRLAFTTLRRLKPPLAVEELDLSANNLAGALQAHSFPYMERLRDLQLAHNSIDSIASGAMAAVHNLSVLSLHHNQIDVLEDHAFRHLPQLSTLDLSHNRIVTISSASLADLVNLVELDLRNNYLRALTADLVLPLRRLADLRLDDNDLSIVASDALGNATTLVRLTLADNPLNCDCSIAEFAKWLRGSALTRADKATVVCTTPPDLENGLLVEVDIGDLHCGNDNSGTSGSVDSSLPHMVAQSAMTSTVDAQGSRINLDSVAYDELFVYLKWLLDDGLSVPYTCDAIFVYEETNYTEVLIDSKPLKCNSTTMPNPQFIQVNLSIKDYYLLYGHKYRYCIVLLAASPHSDDVNIVLGCSDIFPLIKVGTVSPKTSTDLMRSQTKVIALQGVLSRHGNLNVDVTIYPLYSHCQINITVLKQSMFIDTTKVNCSAPLHTFTHLDNDGPYYICASVVNDDPTKEKTVRQMQSEVVRCISSTNEELQFTTLDVAFVSIFVTLGVMLVALVWAVRRVYLARPPRTSQYFMPIADLNAVEMQQQRKQYVKLNATTKV